MKKIFTLILSVILLCGVLSGCGNKTESHIGGDIDASGTQETVESNSEKVNNTRDPMPTYEKLGSKNSIATTDGRYIYYIRYDSASGDSKLCRTDMNGQNQEELWAQNNFSDIYIDDGYLYISHGLVADRIDIAKAPNYFMGQDGYVANNSIIGDASTREFRGMSLTCADENYIYFESTGIYRVKKDTTGLERIVYGEDFVNFYDLQVSEDYLYAYCGDDQKLYRMNTDGSNMTEVCKPMESHVIHDDYVYYIVSGENHTQSLTKTKLDGSETSTIGVLNESWGNVSILNAMEDKIYFLHRGDDSSTYTLKTYDLTTATVSDIYTFESNTIVDATADIVSNYIFLELEIANNKTLYKMNIDGSSVEKIGE